MQFETFCHLILKEMMRRLPEQCPSLRPVLKNNDIEQVALYIRQSDAAYAPMVYLEPYYEEYANGMPFSRVCDDILQYYTQPCPAPSLYTLLKNLSDPAPYLRIRLLQLSSNQRLLSDVPYESYLDLAAVCELSFETGDLDGTALIHTRHLQEWGLTKEAAFQTAWYNSITLLPPVLRPVEDPLFFYEETRLQTTDNSTPSGVSLQDICSRWLSLMHNASCPLFALSNSRCFHGAACMLYPGILAQIAAGFGTDLYLIPSSIHEVLVVPRFPQAHQWVLTEILQEVNKESVLPTEILGAHLYYYDGTAHRLSALPACPDGCQTDAPKDVLAL